MVKQISNIVDSALPMIGIASFAAGAFMGRKFGLAAGYSVSSKVVGLIGKQNVAEKYSKASNDYWTLAKKDAFRDLTAAAGFITLGVASNLAGKALAKEPKEEPGWFDNIPVLSTLCEYKKTVLVVTVLGFSLLLPDSLTEKATGYLLKGVINNIEKKQDLIFSFEWLDSLFKQTKERGHNPVLIKQYFDLRAQMGST
jgi:hypothetical protein